MGTRQLEVASGQLIWVRLAWSWPGWSEPWADSSGRDSVEMERWKRLAAEAVKVRGVVVEWVRVSLEGVAAGVRMEVRRGPGGPRQLALVSRSSRVVSVGVMLGSLSFRLKPGRSVRAFEFVSG